MTMNNRFFRLSSSHSPACTDSVPAYFKTSANGVLRGALLAFATLLSATALPAGAGVLSFTGGFVNDDDLWIKEFSLSQLTEITARTWSFGGGVNGNGAHITAGGFDPVLAVFENSAEGLLLGLSRGGTDPAAPDANPFNGLVWDAYLQMELNAGSYRLVLSQDDNLPWGPSWDDGYLWTGNPNFTSQNSASYDPGARFVMADGTPLDGHWAVDLSPFDLPNHIPEPSTLPLVLAGLACCLGGGRMGRAGRPGKNPTGRK